MAGHPTVTLRWCARPHGEMASDITCGSHSHMPCLYYKITGMSYVAHAMFSIYFSSKLLLWLKKVTIFEFCIVICSLSGSTDSF